MSDSTAPPIRDGATYSIVVTCAVPGVIEFELAPGMAYRWEGSEIDEALLADVPIVEGESYRFRAIGTKFWFEPMETLTADGRPTPLRQEVIYSIVVTCAVPGVIEFELARGTMRSGLAYRLDRSEIDEALLASVPIVEGRPYLFRFDDAGFWLEPAEEDEA